MSQDDFGRAMRVASRILDALETEEEEDPAVVVAALAIAMATVAITEMRMASRPSTLTDLRRILTDATEAAIASAPRAGFVS